MLSALDEAGLQNMASRGSRTVLWMTGNADRSSAKALDPVLPILRLHVEERAARKTRAIDKFGRSHRSHPGIGMPRLGHWLPTSGNDRARARLARILFSYVRHQWARSK